MNTKIRSCLTGLLIALLLVAVGTFIAFALFASDETGFNYKDLLNLNKNSQSSIEKKVEDIVNRRVVVLEENAVIDVIQNASPAVVSIVQERVGVDPFRGVFQEESGIGTGFLIDGEFVFTNRHVVDIDTKYRVVLKDGTNFSVTEVHKDPLNDFAILRVDNQSKNLHSLELGDSDNLKVGQTVVAIGNALGEFSNTASKGIVSGIGRTITAGGGLGGSEVIDNVIQTDAALNPGNSGGPLLDLEGKVIGINIARASAENIGFSIPINSIKSVYESFKEVGEIQRPFLGIEYRYNSFEASLYNNIPAGAVILNVVSGTPADKAGVEIRDVIVKIDGEEVTEENSLAKLIAQKKVGDVALLEVVRDGKEIELKATLEAAR